MLSQSNNYMYANTSIGSDGGGGKGGLASK